MKLHVLDGDENTGRVRAVIHVAVPTGSNAANVAWKDALLASGRTGSTVLATGAAPYQITTAERALVVAGDLAEIVAYIPLRGLNAAEQDEHVTEAIRQWREDVRRELKHFGAARG